MAIKNKNLPKTPQIWINGKRCRFSPECAGCGLVAEEARPFGWEYVELNPEDGWGYLCPGCQHKP